METQSLTYVPRLIFWETTKGCNLSCVHCRAVPSPTCSPEDLSTEQCRGILEQIVSFARPIVVLTGGEPLLRPDILDLASHGTSLGLRMALATNGTLVDQGLARRIVDSGIKRVSISLDGPDVQTHDTFRKMPGAFEAALRGYRHLKAQGMSMQINTTVTRHNAHKLSAMLDLVLELGVDAWHLFLLVPVGCGLQIADGEMVPGEDYERILNWLYDRSKEVLIDLKATCAPHYFRIRAQRIFEEKQQGLEPQPFVAPGTQRMAGHVDGPPGQRGHGMSAMTKGCLAGTGICFISNRGEVFPCGYLPVAAGDLKQASFAEIWESSEVFARLRDPDQLKGKCGACEFKYICEGCRARAYGETGDYLAQEPYCIHVPRAQGIPEGMLPLGGKP